MTPDAAPPQAQASITEPAHPPHAGHAPAPPRSALDRRRNGGSSGDRTFTFVAAVGVTLVLAALGAAAWATGAVGDGGDRSPLRGPLDRSYGYYHDREFGSDLAAQGTRWSTRTGTDYEGQDPIGKTSRWVYDGPTSYGPYGSDAIGRRAGGQHADPVLDRRLGSARAQGGDVFSSYTNLDPAGQAPAAQIPGAWTTPYYDPYAGYANPYANRLRMAWGIGYDSWQEHLEP